MIPRFTPAPLGDRPGRPSFRSVPRAPRRRLAALFLAPALLAAAGAGPARAADPAARVDAEIGRILEQVTTLRHHIHQYPELGNRETETAALVAEHLRTLGLEVETGIAYTGVIGVLRGGRPGPLVAVRADMDALPVTEETPYPFRSEVRTTYLGKEVGVMHACGHDVHTAVLLGVASVLSALRDDLAGTVQFIFQPAEEGPPPGEEGGAELMLAEGIWDEQPPAAVFGLHAYAEMPVGTVGYTLGPAFAAVDHFKAKVRGKQSHGAQPQQSVDPVVMAAQAVMALQTIRSRNLHPLEPSVVSVGIIRGGERFNIIPAQVHLEGTVRTYDPDVRDTVERRMGEILDGITRAAGGSFELDYDRGSPAVINDEGLAEIVLPGLRRAVGESRVMEIPPTMGGEDFALFANEVPGFYFRLGSVHPDIGSGGHHTPDFQADDASLEVGMRALSHVVLTYLAEAPGAAAAASR